MNTPSPLVPQGTSPARGKSSLYFKVMMILTVHVVLIGGMLLQGCKDTNKPVASDTSPKTDDTSATAANSTDTTNLPPLNTTYAAPAPMAPVGQPAATNYQVMAPVAAPAGPAPMLNNTTTPMTASAPAPMTAPVMSSDAKEYVIARGDTLAVIAKHNGVSLKALMEANPGVDAKKLRIGAKLQLPASASGLAASSSSPAATPGSTAAPATDGAVAADGAVYTVKAGDTLSRIARSHGTTFKKIMALNELRTTSIRVGQKLKLPSARTTSTDSTAASAAVTSTMPMYANANTAPVAAR